MIHSTYRNFAKAACAMLLAAIWMGHTLPIRVSAAENAMAKIEQPSQPFKGDPYPLSFCAVTGNKLDPAKEPVIYSHEGREIRFCSQDCIAKFKADPKTYLDKIDKAIIEQQKPFYPLEKCVVTGEKLGGDMGKPVEYVYKNRLVRFCCTGCVKGFEKEPAKYFPQIEKAVIEKQSAAYPLKTCVVSGKDLGAMGQPVTYVQGNRLFKLCCPACIEKIQKNPLVYTGKLDEAAKKQ
ncbi:MAG: hypothetical protein NTX50_22005 [Candidatus Sumerlaeota bacterium]|nr:hypothetical protein [Candidatus Sumerlaeota bacterium]